MLNKLEMSKTTIKKKIFIIMTLLIATATFFYFRNRTLIEWGEITYFYISWDDGVNTGSEITTFEIEKIEGQYFLTAHSQRMRLFVPENHPISNDEVEMLLQLLQENRIDRWNGFEGNWSSFRFRNTRNFTLDIRVAMDTGSEIEAFVATGRSPQNFDRGFQRLRSFLEEMAELHKTAPEWGEELNSFSYDVRTGGASHLYARYSLDLEDDGRVHFRKEYPCAQDSNNRNLICVAEGFFEVDVLERLHDLMIDYDIYEWWDGLPNQGGTIGRTITLRVRFDNGTILFATGAIRREHSESAHYALLAFFDELFDEVIFQIVDEEYHSSLMRINEDISSRLASGVRDEFLTYDDDVIFNIHTIVGIEELVKNTEITILNGSGSPVYVGRIAQLEVNDDWNNSETWEEVDVAMEGEYVRLLFVGRNVWDSEYTRNIETRWIIISGE